ncbi:MAG: DUF421 domain-containing protein [Deltaproteobacteria bacterium]|nr:DUF421 domain-containing protein [Deltaproteobacteria bacterium]
MVNPVLRAVVIYFFLLVVFRLSGKRSLSQLTSFDFVLLLIIAEATQQGLIGNDFSLTQALLLIMTLIGIDILISLLKQRFPRLERWVDGIPLVIVENGRPLKHLMDKERIDEKDVLTAARETQGLERMEQIRYAVLERSGGISIIPNERSS